MMSKQFVIDCGSRSIKLHEARSGAVSLAATRSWDPINDARNVERVGELLADLTKGLPAVSTIHVVGTAAARRDPRLADAIGEACAALGWSYETLSHQAEAGLILDAFGGRADCDIVNAGGGSMLREEKACFSGMRSSSNSTIAPGLRLIWPPSGRIC